MEPKGKKVYIVYVDTVYTDDGKNPLESYWNAVDLEPIKVGEFEDIESAMTCYNDQYTNYSYDEYNRLYEHRVKYIDVIYRKDDAEESDNGIIYSDGWICLDFPEKDRYRVEVSKWSEGSAPLNAETIEYIDEKMTPTQYLKENCDNADFVYDESGDLFFRIFDTKTGEEIGEGVRGREEL